MMKSSNKEDISFQNPNDEALWQRLEEAKDNVAGLKEIVNELHSKNYFVESQQLIERLERETKCPETLSILPNMDYKFTTPYSKYVSVIMVIISISSMIVIFNSFHGFSNDDHYNLALTISLMSQPETYLENTTQIYQNLKYIVSDSFVVSSTKD